MDAPLASPFAEAVGGLLLGSAEFVERMERLLSPRTEDRSLPGLGKLRHRPPLTSIARIVAKHFGTDADNWQPETRQADASRAVTAYLARREFGHRVQQIADALGYRSHGSVRNAILHVESGNNRLRRDVHKLKEALTND
jgi:chromosomal replication initiation ATPase DnaA